MTAYSCCVTVPKAIALQCDSGFYTIHADVLVEYIRIDPDVKAFFN
jgi:hypothetical protein